LLSRQHVRVRCEIFGPPITAPAVPPTTAPTGPATTAPAVPPIAAPVTVRSVLLEALAETGRAANVAKAVAMKNLRMRILQTKFNLKNNAQSAAMFTL
jgi:hypothetical protein